jgi:predicted nuclease of predicted toxin-antitoxin system
MSAQGHLRFLADMNLSPQTVADLQAAGWDILRVNQVLLATTSDRDILAYARRDNRVIITQDLDFSTLLALAGFSSPSLVTLRLSVTDPDTVTRRLLQVVPQSEAALLGGAAVTVNDNSLRVRSLPIR